MKKLLALLMLLPLYALAQNSTVTGNISAAGTTCATTGACVQIQLPQGTSTVAVNVIGTFVATLNFEQSADGGNTWVQANGFIQPGLAISNSTTTTGVWTITAASMTNVRVRGSAYTSGTAAVTLQASSGVASSQSLTLNGGSTVAISQATPGTSNAVQATNFPATVDTNAGSATANTIRVTGANFPNTVDTNAGSATANTLRVTQANGQSTPASGNITAAGGTCTGTTCVSLGLFGTSGTAVITVTGTFSATLQFETTANDAAATYGSIQCNPIPSGVPVSSTTTAGTFICQTSAFSTIRVRASTYTSGTAVVTINQATAPNPSTSPAISQNVIPDISSTTQINAGLTQVTPCHSTLNVQGIQINLQSDQNLSIEVDQFPDSACATTGQAYTYTVSTPIKTNPYANYTVQATNSFYQVRVTNTSGSNTTTFRVDIALCPIALPGFASGGTQGVVASGSAALGFPVLVGGVNGGNIVNLAVDSAGRAILGAGTQAIGTVTASNFPATVDTNNGTTSASTQRVTISSDSTGQVKLATGTAAIGNVQGNSASNSATTNPIVSAGIAQSTGANPTAASSGNQASFLSDTNGAEWVRLGGPNQFNCTVTLSTATTTQCQAAPAAGLKAYITGFIINTTTAGTGSTIQAIQGTGTNCGTGTANLSAIAYPNTAVGITSQSNTVIPLIPTAANAVCFKQTGTAGTSVIEAYGFIAP